MAGEASDSAGAQGSRPAALADAAGLATATPQRVTRNLNHGPCHRARALETLKPGKERRHELT